MKYRKRPIVIDATQWFKNGDHPLDGPPGAEGKVVRYFRLPCGLVSRICETCHSPMHDHGWIDSPDLAGVLGHTVCPGDWIITGIAGEHYPCKPQIFEATYEPVTFTKD